MAEPKTITEEIQLSGDKLISTVKDLLHEGNVRHIVIKNAQGGTVIEFPVNIGVVGFLVAPILAPLAALVVVAADYKIVVTRDAPS